MVTLSTTDFFFPLVDDPYRQGGIAAANVLSDLYSLGVRHVDTVLMSLALSLEMDVVVRKKVAALMIEGFNDKCKEAGKDF
ncbi:hypothetical protein MHBO_001701 [Bonamia ostreae]|uniref:PurM-like N-terminal domain-containing protein n=1 Tax=Bonamia ostreae TaxID=126728 RepID=A0ABV2AKE7_9EUKA